MLTQFLDWLDEAAGGLIRLAYLLAGVTAVAVYFGAGQLPTWLDQPLNAALPWALAFALETHTYLIVRRVRAAWEERDQSALKVNLGVLAVLLAFSAWNQLGYLGGVWHPQTTGPLALPAWLAYSVRALIVPCAFMAAAFLAPLAPPITAQIEGEARATLADVFKIARRQRKALLRKAETSGRDLTGALVELVPDAETRRIIGHAYAAIGAAPASPVVPAVRLESDGSARPAQLIETESTPTETGSPPPARASEGQESASSAKGGKSPIPDRPDRPPTDGGVPLASNPRPKTKRTGDTMGGNVTPLRRGMGQPPRRDRRMASRANARSGQRGTAEQRVRAVIASDPTLSFEEVVKEANVSASSASKWRAVIEAEQASQRQAAQSAH